MFSNNTLVNQLDAHLQHVLKECEDLKRKLQFSDEERKRLSDMVSSLKAGFAEQIRADARLIEQRDRNADALRVTNERFKALSEENQALKARLVQCADREAELRALRAHNTKLVGQLHDAEEQIINHERMIATLRQEKANLKTEAASRFQTVRNAVATAQLFQTEQHMRSAEAALIEKNREIEELRQENQIMKDRLAAPTTDISEKRAEVEKTFDNLCDGLSQFVHSLIEV